MDPGELLVRTTYIPYDAGNDPGRARPCSTLECCATGVQLATSGSQHGVATIWGAETNQVTPHSPICSGMSDCVALGSSRVDKDWMLLWLG